MEPSERETVILLNKADLADGYFIFGTCSRSHFNKLCKRVGGKEKLLEVRVEKTWFEAKVPKSFLSLRTFGIKPVRKQTTLNRKAVCFSKKPTKNA